MSDASKKALPSLALQHLINFDQRGPLQESSESSVAAFPAWLQPHRWASPDLFSSVPCLCSAVDASALVKTRHIIIIIIVVVKSILHFLSTRSGVKTRGLLEELDQAGKLLDYYYAVWIISMMAS